MRFENRVLRIYCKRAGKYFASILVDTQDYDPKAPANESVGVDFGIKDLAVCSNGKTFAANQKLKHSLKRLARNKPKNERQQLPSESQASGG